MSSPPALDWSTDNCTVARAMEILGERWTLVVLREIFNGVRRFDQIREHSGVPRQVLTNRLTMLRTADVLVRHPYRESGERQRYEYRLTDKGFDIYPILVAVRDWGDRYLAGPEGSPLNVVHRDCEAMVHNVLMCEDGHVISSPREIAARPGPGVKPRPANTR